jgi:dihydropteroate synthase
MGIVNVTPDSFSDGGQFADPTVALDHARRLEAEGVDILEVGGESTRPGSHGVTVEEELRRVVPVMAELAKRTTLPISVDTTKAEVARRCLEAGAHIVNDVTGLRGDPDMPRVVAELGAGVVLMHMQGTPDTMQANPHYEDVVHEVGEFFEERLHASAKAGISRDMVCLDPGIGFGKSIDHNLDVLANLGAFARFGRPVCLGVSRKGFVGTICGRAVAERMPGSLAVACVALARRHAHVLRVHDVAPHRDAVRMLAAIEHHRR